MSRAERGQSLVEGTLVMLVFFALMFGVIDCGQVLVAHQALVERVRSAARWGVVHPWDGTGEQIANLILYNQSEEPRTTTDGYLGLTRANVQVRYQPPAPSRPDDGHSVTRRASGIGAGCHGVGLRPTGSHSCSALARAGDRRAGRGTT